MLGDFDGKTFTPDAPEKQRLWYGNFYAAQTYSNAPDGRRVQIGWGNGIAFPDMPFNQQMAFPCRLTLRKTADGVRMYAEPVTEIETLNAKKHAVADRTLHPGDNPLADVGGEICSTPPLAEFEPGDGEAFELVTVRERAGCLRCKETGRFPAATWSAPLRSRPDGKVAACNCWWTAGRIEIFGNGGRVAFVGGGVIPADDNHALEVFSRGERDAPAVARGVRAEIGVGSAVNRRSRGSKGPPWGGARHPGQEGFSAEILNRLWRERVPELRRGYNRVRLGEELRWPTDRRVWPHPQRAFPPSQLQAPAGRRIIRYGGHRPGSSAAVQTPELLLPRK